jgi:exopolysaccharide biosynthesis polyprenyl glycosylphosphotransferase
VLAAILNQSWPPPFHVVGFIDDDPEKLSMTIEGFSVLGDHSKIFEVVENEHVSDIIISISGQIDARTFEMLTLAEEQGIEVTTMPVVYEELLGRVPVYLLQSDWILRTFFDQAHTEGVFETLKRLIDILGGIIGTLILLPILPLIALVIFIDSGTPIFYSQVRLGQRGKPYRILKFRTMRQDAEKDGLAKAAVKDDDRVTRVGKILRKSHLDELPQFINILRGDMSLVGPRAERPEIVDEYQKNIPFYRGRLLVRPGLTGWAQVNYGYASNVEQNAIKLEYDLYYIMHRNLSLDFTIMLRTVGTVIGFRGQ